MEVIRGDCDVLDKPTQWRGVRRSVECVAHHSEPNFNRLARVLRNINGSHADVIIHIRSHGRIRSSAIGADLDINRIKSILQILKGTEAQRRASRWELNTVQHEKT